MILDHVLLGIATPFNVVAGGIGMLLRYTRYSFFALTGFVLTYQYRNRELKPLEFWRRRYKLIGLPFVVWTLFYWTYGRYEGGGWTGLRDQFANGHDIELALKSIGYDLLTGNSWYHLYFLSVSMQIYAIYPLLLWVLRRTWGYHRYLLAVSFAFQLLVMAVMTGPPRPYLHYGVLDVLMRHLVVTIIPYQFFILAGCVAAMHYEAFQRFMIRWRWPLLALCTVVITVALVNYASSVDDGTSVARASNAFLPHSAITFMAIIAVLYIVGTIWQTRRRPGSIADALMRKAADRSFGIYLAHALALAELQSVIGQNRDHSPGLVIAVAFVATVALTVFLVEVLRLSPLSLITTGRSMISPSEQRPARSAMVAVAAIVIGIGLRLGVDLQAGNLIAATGLLLLMSAGYVAWRRRQATSAVATGN
ncbi:acyltransferase [Gordonia sinesedis]